jgi:hypothetical protein
MHKTMDFFIIVKLLAKLGLDYVRWTQFVPMILGWAFALLMTLGILLVVFQGGIDTLLERTEPAVERILGPAPGTGTNGISSGDGPGLQFTEDDIVPWVLRVWGWLAFAGWIVSILRTMLFGPRTPWSLRRKIKIAGAGAGSLAGIILTAYLLIGDLSGNTLPQLMVPFILLPAGLWIVSIWSLSVSRFIDFLQATIDRLGNGKEKPDVSFTTTA